MKNIDCLLLLVLPNSQHYLSGHVSLALNFKVIVNKAGSFTFLYFNWDIRQSLLFLLP